MVYVKVATPTKLGVGGSQVNVPSRLSVSVPCVTAVFPVTDIASPSASTSLSNTRIRV